MTHSGFTLIELSIVLVIIGLLVGGVLVGRDLIHAAEIRKTIKQTEQFDAAINTFRNKYNCLPGDCTNPASFGFTTDLYGNHTHGAPLAGNGDGKISDDGYYALGYGEAEEAFWWLQQAGLIDGVNISDDSGGDWDFYSVVPAALVEYQPLSYLSPEWQLTYATWNVVYVDTTIDLASGNKFFPQSGHYYILSSDIWSNDVPTAITPADAFAIDAKMDDGLPRSGRVLASGNDNFDQTGPAQWPMPVSDPTGAVFGTADEGSPGNGASNAYCVVSATPPVYNVQNTSQINGATNLVNPGISSLCTLTVAASF